MGRHFGAAQREAAEADFSKLAPRARPSMIAEIRERQARESRAQSEREQNQQRFSRWLRAPNRLGA